MIKKLFNTKKDFIDFLWDNKSWKIDMCISVEKRNDLAPHLGVEFKGLYDITGLEEDDGKWAGKNHYKWNEGILPKQFPAIMVLQIGRVKYTNLYSAEYIYLNDFK
jgi:hypothetical protein